MKNKILHITTVHSFDDNRIFQKEIKSLKKAGFDVSIIAQGVKDQVVDGINVYSVPFQEDEFDITFHKPKTIKHTIITNFRILLKTIRLNPTICHFHDPDFILPAIILSLIGKKIVYDVHEDVPRQILAKQWIPKVFRNLISKLFSFLEFISGRFFFKLIIAATPVIALRFPKKKTETIMNYPRLSEFQNHKPNKNKELSLIYIGSIGITRGIEQLIEAFNKINHKSAKLYLAGDFEDKEMKDRTLARIKSKNIDYLGYLNRSDVAHYLSKAMVGLVVLHPTRSYIDSYPTKLFEYMGMGLPVIGSNFPIWEEIIKGSNCGITINPFNVGELSSAIDFLLKNQVEAFKMGLNGREAILKKYNWDIEKIKLIDKYNQII